MINFDLSFPLPPPWENKSFETDQIGPINFLVGPNGSGKSQFAHVLSMQLRNVAGGAHLVRLLGTDRLEGMEQTTTLGSFRADNFSEGFRKREFGNLKNAGAQGSGIDTIVILEERMDLRIQIQATLSHLFNREIALEWDSGNLIPMVARSGGGASYRLDREECHGIKELLVLLTHLYDDQRHYLIIDEPELNLHPQYQAFFMQEVRKLTDSKKKVVFLITHSPFILNLRTSEDLKSIVSFDLKYAVPTQVAQLGLDIHSPNHFIRRLNAHHKQLFFSDNPVFVEGIHDAWLIEAMMDARGASVAGAGSCIIDAGGAEEVNQYLKLCLGLGKHAHFLYDLDSLFHGNLRGCIRDDTSIQSFLASAGLGNDFARYCGQLDGKLTCLIDQMLITPLTGCLKPLGEFLQEHGARCKWDKRKWANARRAMMTAISKYRDDVVSAASRQLVEDIEGHREQILTVLKQKNIYVLPAGTLEQYLPNYSGDEYNLSEKAKRQAVYSELNELGNLCTEEELSNRYGQLYEVVCNLPSKPDVNVEPVLRDYLSDYFHELQKTAKNNPDWQQDKIQERLNAVLPSTSVVFSIQRFDRHKGEKFGATIEIIEMLGQGKRIVQVSDKTNAGMGDFKIESVQKNSEDGT